ncbi:hypothetical protein BCR43DRAFT_351307 [Syncephalastrum racemosum]|uniref:Uncharacterized protein n=1 Tax=Syncephalastrum racemosum TaxID=13706 RepID=A0A1X2H655_SYNRA|nr:hypothetical protein BCR43DRAFT_351307 [Syncephalastrum racemosum]
MLTEDQSSCLVLDLDPTLGKSGERQGYLRATAGGGHLSHGTNPMDPVAVGKSLIGRNPFKYQSYEMTPPSSPQLSPVSDAESGNDDRESASTNCSQQLGVNYSKANIMKTAKLLFEAADPGNTLIYRRMFLTNRAVYQRLQQVFPALDQHHSHLQISAWLTAERAHFGEVKTRRHGKRRERGRWLWVYKAAVAENLQETDGRFRSHCRKTTGNWVNVGYVRKSKTLESDQSRVRHLQTVMATLVNRCMCTKLFASPCSSSTANLLGWDFKRSELLTRLDDCDGDTQGT